MERMTICEPLYWRGNISPPALSHVYYGLSMNARSKIRRECTCGGGRGQSKSLWRKVIRDFFCFYFKVFDTYVRTVRTYVRRVDAREFIVFCVCVCVKCSHKKLFKTPLSKKSSENFKYVKIESQYAQYRCGLGSALAAE